MRRNYLKPTTEIVLVQMERIMGDATSWSTDSGKTTTGIIDGNPGDTGYRPNRKSPASMFYEDDENDY